LLNWDYIKYELAEQWRRLAVRERLNAHPREVVIITSICVFILLAVIVAILIPDEPSAATVYKKGWFYDLNTGRLFTARYDAKPPIKAPSAALPDGQPAGVRACVLSYVDEPNESQRFIAFLAKADPNAETPAASSAASQAATNGLLMPGLLIRTIEDANWVPADSQRGRSIIKKAFCPDLHGRYPKYCLPE